LLTFKLPYIGHSKFKLSGPQQPSLLIGYLCLSDRALNRGHHLPPVPI